MTNQLPQALLEAEVQTICKRYRIDPAGAREVLEDCFAKQPRLLQKILARYPAEDVTRLSDYRRVIKAAKKQIYYRLRRYHQAEDREKQLKRRLEALLSEAADAGPIKAVAARLLATHISTRERFPHYEMFYETLFKVVDSPRTIIDLGCGLHPLSYPFLEHAQALERYIAIDKDPQVIDLLSLYASQVEPVRLTPVCADLTTVTWADYLGRETQAFDLTLMLKLIPAIQRRQPDLAPRLATIPTRMMVVTASTEAMTRKENIRRREARELRRFIEITGRPVIGGFEAGNEFGYVLGSETDNARNLMKE